MDQIKIDFSMKNIGSYSKRIYDTMMLESIERLVNSCRWKLHFHKLRNGMKQPRHQFEATEEQASDNFGFKSTSRAPADKDLVYF